VNQRRYLGIDGGGTHTRTIVVDAAGRVLGAGRSGSTNRNHHPRETVLANLREAISRALSTAGETGELRAVFLGMCGTSTEADRREIVSIARQVPEVPPGARMAVENDTHTGLVGGLSGRPGAVLIAGTGSACLGLAAGGRRCLCGGWGALADDAGSAPWIGLQAIQAAVRSEDGRIGPTALRDLVFGFLGLSEPRELIDRVHNRGLSREEIGRLAPLVIRASLAGDAVAGEILGRAAGCLSEMVAVVARGLGVNGRLELVLVGGLALSGPPFQPRLIERIVRDTPQVSVTEPEMPPVKGAALEALRLDGVPWTADVLRNLRAAGGEDG
jgi:N-acetylglucosamine kinase-like BadF-type ATPase